MGTPGREDRASIARSVRLRCAVGWKAGGSYYGGVKWFRRGDLAPEPPPELAALGMAPGYTVKLFPSQAALDKYARQWGVSADDQWNKRSLVSAVIPALKLVCRLQPGLEDSELANSRDVHENGHTWGWRHAEGGGGWIPPKDWSWDAAKAQAAAAQKAQQATEQAKAAADPATTAVQLAKNLTARPADPTQAPTKPSASAAGGR